MELSRQKNAATFKRKNSGASSVRSGASSEDSNEVTSSASPSCKKSPKAGTKTGRWSPEEHRKFLHGIAENGRNWEKVASAVGTRTTVQVRSHAQKYFKKIILRENTLKRSRPIDDSNGSITSDIAGGEELDDDLLRSHAARLVGVGRVAFTPTRTHLSTLLRCIRECDRRLSCSIFHFSDSSYHTGMLKLTMTLWVTFEHLLRRNRVNNRHTLQKKYFVINQKTPCTTLKVPHIVYIV
jgi:SHAQKYF class myb-like DNA-binding protein